MFVIPDELQAMMVRGNKNIKVFFPLKIDDGEIKSIDSVNWKQKSIARSILRNPSLFSVEDQ